MLRRLLDSPWTYFVLAGVLVVGGVLSQIRIGIPARPKGDVSNLGELRARDDLNVLFILIDTLRMDALSSYGSERPTSPLIDAVGESGVRFAHARAQSSGTKTSMASLWLASYPNRTGILRFDQAISPAAPLPAEVLKRAGLLTTGLHRNPWVERNFGFARGFDVYLFPTPAPSQQKATRRSGRRERPRHRPGRARVPAIARARTLLPVSPSDGRAPVLLGLPRAAVRHVPS